MRTGCTRECLGDQDCPQGSICDSVYPIHHGDFPTPSALCRPGARSNFGTGLACLSP